MQAPTRVRKLQARINSYERGVTTGRRPAEVWNSNRGSARGAESRGENAGKRDFLSLSLIHDSRHNHPRASFEGIARSQISHRSPLKAVGDVAYENRRLPRLGNARTAWIPLSIVRDLAELSQSRLHNLPESREEVFAIAQIAGPQSRLLLGADATETALKQATVSDYRIIQGNSWPVQVWNPSASKLMVAQIGQRVARMNPLAACCQPTSLLARSATGSSSVCLLESGGRSIIIARHRKARVRASITCRRGRPRRSEQSRMESFSSTDIPKTKRSNAGSSKTAAGM